MWADTGDGYAMEEFPFSDALATQTLTHTHTHTESEKLEKEERICRKLKHPNIGELQCV